MKLASDGGVDSSEDKRETRAGFRKRQLQRSGAINDWIQVRVDVDRDGGNDESKIKTSKI